MFLDFEEYKNRNGNISDVDMFTYYEPIAFAKLNYYTQGRIKNLLEIPDCVQDAFVRIVDLLYQYKDRDFKACTNDGVSVTYADNLGVDAMIVQTIREVLPPELTFRGMNV